MTRYDEALRGLARDVGELSFADGLYHLREHLLPVLEAAEQATEICDEDDNCKACQLRTALDKLIHG